MINIIMVYVRKKAGQRYTPRAVSYFFVLGWNGFIYVLSGRGEFGGGGDDWTQSEAHYTLVLGPGDHVEAKNTVRLAATAS